MQRKITFASILFIFILMLSLTGCDSSDSEDSEAVAETPPDAPHTEEHLHDDDCDHNDFFSDALASFPPETIMLESDMFSITWAELYVFLFRTVSELFLSYGAVPDWAESVGPDKNMADAVLEYATNELLSMYSFMYGAASLNFSLSDDDLNVFNSDLDSLFEMYGSKEELEEALRENAGFYNFDVFESMFKVEFTTGVLINKLYGDNFSSFPDEYVAGYALQNDYMMAMHILRLKTDDDDDAPLKEIEDILVQLNDFTNNEGLTDFFHTMMIEHSEDYGGMQSFPDGYLFQHTDMVGPFSDACAALEPGQISDIVESVYGYHIILRLPIDYDTVPIAVSNEGYTYSLRQLAALYDFDSLHQGWLNALDITYTPEYESIDLSTVFVIQ